MTALDPRLFKGLSRFLAPSAGGPLADRALAEKAITPEQLDECVREQDQTGRPLDEILVARGFLKAEEVTRLRQAPVPPEVAEAMADPLRQMGHYVRVSLLGVGGMAEVWKAWDKSLGRWVALKYLKPDVGHPTQRIEREGRMAGGLSHPNVISIYERGTHEGRPYLVMPYVEGSPPKAPLDPREAARIALDVAAALAHAHDRGVIHRDVKPHNIILDHAGRVYLMDFGLAIPDDSATSRWAISGTPEYASPEQVRGDRLDFRTDLYSLGATLHHLLSGRPPFSGGAPEEIADQVLHAVPAPPPGPRPLTDLVRRAMDRDPQRRQGSAGELADELRRFLAARPRSSLFRPATVAAMLLVAAFSWGVTYAILSRGTLAEQELQVSQLLREGEKALARAEQLRADPAARKADIEEAARRAIPHFNVAIRTAGGEDAQGSAGLGRCYELLGMEERAEGAYREARGLPSGKTRLAALWVRRHLEGRKDKDWGGEVRRELAGVPGAGAEALLALAEKRWEEAAAKAAAAQEPYDETLHLAGGVALVELKRWDEALARLDQAVRLRRGDPVALFHRALALEGKGDRAGAKADFEAVARSSSPLRLEARRRLLIK